MDRNKDLIGKVYRNGPDGFLYTVQRIVDNDPDFVISRRNADGEIVTALAKFVRLAIDDERIDK